MELETTTFGFAFQIRANSTIGPVAAGSDSAVGQSAFISSYSRRPQTIASIERVRSLNQARSSSSTIVQSSDWIRRLDIAVERDVHQEDDLAHG
jgi:hypothetical protein